MYGKSVADACNSLSYLSAAGVLHMHMLKLSIYRPCMWIAAVCHGCISHCLLDVASCREVPVVCCWLPRGWYVYVLLLRCAAVQSAIHPPGVIIADGHWLKILTNLKIAKQLNLWLASWPI